MNRCNFLHPHKRDPAQANSPLPPLALPRAVAISPPVGARQQRSTQCMAWVALSLGMTTLASLPITAQAQEQAQLQVQVQAGVRPFPVNAKRGVFEVQAWPLVLINNTSQRLSPGARIRGVNNMLMLSGQLVGQRLLVNYLLDGQGMVHEVWVLNELEAQQERAGMESTKNWVFESDPVKSK